MIKKYHNHTLQTNPWHRKEETQNINRNKTSGRQLKQSIQLSLPRLDDCKTSKRAQRNAYQNKDQAENTHKKWEVHKTMNQQQQSHRRRPVSSLSLWGALMHFTGTKFSP